MQATPPVEWQPEPELACATPRRTVLRRSVIAERAFFIGYMSFIVLGGAYAWLSYLGLTERSGSILVVLCIMPLGLILWCGILASVVSSWKNDGLRDALLVRSAIPTLGIVGEVVTSRTNGRYAQWIYTSTIVYETPEPRTLCASTARTRKVGDTLTVLYLPADPDRAKPYEECCYRAAKPKA